MKEWTRTDADDATRVGHLNGSLSGGLNGAAWLSSATVQDDGAIDHLFGGGGSDWFFALSSGANGDWVYDWVAGEMRTTL
jgi:hypothetical protein